MGGFLVWVLNLKKMKNTPDMEMPFLLTHVATLWSLGGPHDAQSLLGQGKGDLVNLLSFRGPQMSVQ